MAALCCLGLALSDPAFLKYSLASGSRVIKIACMKKLIIVLACLLVIAGYASSADLTTYNATYEKSLGDIALSHAMTITDLGAQYTKALNELLEAVKKTGDLDDTTAVLNEIKRFEDARAMPEKLSDIARIKNMQFYYSKQASAHDLDKAKKIVALTSQYDQAMEKLQKGLVASSNLEDARAVQAARKKAQEDAAYKGAVGTMKNLTVAKNARPLPKQRTLVLWNTHNVNNNDRGTKKCDILLFKGEKHVWGTKGVTIPWKANTATKVSLKLPVIPFDRVRVEITEYVNRGGGLSEIQVLQDEENLALNGKAEASSTYDNRFPANAVTDGMVEHSGMKGYWLLTDGKLGWIDVHLKLD